MMPTGRMRSAGGKKAVAKGADGKGKRAGKGRSSKSPKSRSPSAKSREEEGPDPQQLQAQLRQTESRAKALEKELETWQGRHASIQAAFDLLTKRYGELKEVIYANSDVYKFDTDSKLIEDIDHDGTKRILEDICYTAKHPPTTESRLEEMETRITKQNSEIAFLLSNNLLYESVLNDFYHTRDVDYIHDKIADTFIETGKTARETPVFPTITVTEIPPPLTEPLPDPPSTFQRLQERLQDIRLVPPVKRMCGSTHIGQMNVDLRMYICRDLNLERRSGCDWRMLARRVGVAEATIDQWRRMKLASPMNRLLAVWGQSEGASVRMLHRHLSSPEMNAVLLARRVEDFYDV